MSASSVSRWDDTELYSPAAMDIAPETTAATPAMIRVFRSLPAAATPASRLPVYAVQKFPWVQVPGGEIGVVIAQVGAPLPIGAKSGVYRNEFGNFSNLAQFIELGGQKGVQRPVLPPGTLMPIHPVAFLVLTP